MRIRESQCKKLDIVDYIIFYCQRRYFWNALFFIVNVVRIRVPEMSGISSRLDK